MNEEELVDACYYGFLHMVKYYVENGANIHFRDDYPLKEACSRGHLDIVKYLIENGANIHGVKDEVLKYAVHYGQLETVKYLVETFCSSVKTKTIYEAPDGGHYHVVKYLVHKLDPQYIITELPEFIEYLDHKYSHVKLTNKFGLFDE